MVEGGRGGRGGHGVVVVDAEVLEEVEEKLVEHVGFWSISKRLQRAFVIFLSGEYE